MDGMTEVDALEWLRSGESDDDGERVDALAFLARLTVLTAA